MHKETDTNGHVNVYERHYRKLVLGWTAKYGMIYYSSGVIVLESLVSYGLTSPETDKETEEH